MCMLVRFLESKASRDIVAHAFAYTKEPQIKPPRNHQVTTNDPPVKHSGTTKEPTWSKASHVRSHIRSRSIERMSKHMTSEWASTQSCWCTIITRIQRCNMAAHGLDLQPPPPPPVDESEDAEDVLEALCRIGGWTTLCWLVAGLLYV